MLSSTPAGQRHSGTDHKYSKRDPAPDPLATVRFGECTKTESTMLQNLDSDSRSIPGDRGYRSRSFAECGARNQNLVNGALCDRERGERKAN